VVRRGLLILLSLAAGPAGADDAPNVIRRPTHVRLDAGFGAPTGIMGASVGHVAWAPWGLEGGFGLGASGWQLALLARHHTPIGDSVRSFFIVAAGPSLSLIGEPFGTRVPRSAGVAVGEGDVYGILGLNVEVGWELRVGWGGIVRVAVGGFLRVAENMSRLCREDATVDDGSGCVPPHLPSPPEVARLPAYPYLVLGYGWSW
jgi:hypothetical protein